MMDPRSRVPSTIMASSKFLSHLHSLFPAASAFAKNSPYAYIAGIAFAAQSRPQDVLAVYLHARSSNSGTGITTMTKAFREALFKTGVLYGMPRMINALAEVVKAIPEEEGGGKDAEPWRSHTLSPETLNDKGVKLFDETYGDKAQEVRSLLKGLHPDFDYFCMTLIYGPVYAYDGILGPAETELAMIAALTAIQSPLQVGWHVDGALRHGASREDVEATKRIAEEIVARVSGELAEERKTFEAAV